MPRPGPRPYECVRRAWHSDRHQPMRGSIIQQIFRVVNDTHSSATKRNREWQEKLPIVVLKAEEIMYSKANSEAEYMNLDTLWERVNDAIDTIIRKDETTETGELLPPCVEAALNLGCIPVRASRSQRHNNPRCYLTPRAQEPIGDILGTSEKPINHLSQHPELMHSANQMQNVRSETMNSGFKVSECTNRVMEKHNIAAPSGFPLFYGNGPCRGDHMINVDANKPPNLGSVYPLYHGIHCQAGEVWPAPQTPGSNVNTILVGRPVGTSGLEPKPANTTQNLLLQDSLESSSNFSSGIEYVKTGKRSLEGKCDLSLRLSLASEPCVSLKGRSDCESEDFDDSGCSPEDSMNTTSPMQNKEFSLFSSGTFTSKPLEHAPCEWALEDGRVLDTRPRKRRISEDESKLMGACLGNRNITFGNSEGTKQFCWSQVLSPNLGGSR